MKAFLAAIRRCAAVVRPWLERLAGWIDLGFIPALSVAIAALLFFLEGRIGLDLTDEGYLWYGAIDTAAGRVPHRDFQSYDPGRYYWSAAWLLMLDNGVVSLRAGLAAFQALGLVFGLLVAKRLVARKWVLVLVAVGLAAWMMPRHKIFEPGLAMAGVYVMMRVWERPGARACFGAGVFIGLAAVVGCNHGLYTAAAFLFTIALLRYWSRAVDLRRLVAAWIGGMALGYAPILLMSVLAPGFFAAFWDSGMLLVRHGLNLPLPVPWPWRVRPSPRAWDTLGGLTMGGLFLWYPAFWVIGLGTLALRRTIPPAAAVEHVLYSSIAMAPYMHHAFSRADLSHLAQSIHPLLLGTGALLLSLPKRARPAALAAWLAFLLGTAAAVFPARPLGDRLRHPASFVRQEVAGDDLLLRRPAARDLEEVRRLVEARIPSDEALLIVPSSPGLYAVLGRRSPIRELYLLRPSGRGRETQMVAALEGIPVAWAIVSGRPVAGRDDLRLRNTHPVLWAYLMDNFEVVEQGEMPAGQKLLRRRSHADSGGRSPYPHHGPSTLRRQPSEPQEPILFSGATHN